MTNGAQFSEKMLNLRFKDKSVSAIIDSLRRAIIKHGFDADIIITLPESKAGGGWLPRPHSQGGPFVFIGLRVREGDIEELIRFMTRDITHDDFGKLITTD